jgi:hypothetical protein
VVNLEGMTEEPEAAVVDIVAPVLDRCSVVAERLARLLLTLLPS